MPGPPQRIEGFSSSYPPHDISIGRARRGVVRWLEDDLCVEEDVIDELAVVVSELVTNAVRATGDAGGDVVVAAGRVQGAVVIEVTNPSAAWVDAANRWDLDDPLRAGGRGLLIVRSLTDDVDVSVDADAGTTTVRCRRVVEPT